MISTYIIIDGYNNVVFFKKYAFIILNILPKRKGREGGGCGTRMVPNFRGVWHKNDFDVKYTSLGY